MHFCGDCSEEDQEEMPFDKEVIEISKKEIERLNNKYKKQGVPIFHFLYRRRVYCKTQEKYLGWERKRGLITEFNRFLLKKEKGSFRENTLNALEDIPKIKYVITLDADTELPLDAGLEAVSAMSHILNAPELSYDKKRVINGYGIMQPRIALNIESSLKSLFTRLFAGFAGIDAYSNAVSDIYQDIFKEAIFTGKGIYDLKIFNEVLEEQIPENIVLSHDLLEGSYLRCALLTDVFFVDGYPSKYNSYVKRGSRWIRGDWQIIRWLKSNLNSISKFKILDNLRRSLIELTTIALLLISIFVKNNMISAVLQILVIILTFRQTILNIINSVIFKSSYLEKQKMFTPVIDGIKGDFLRNVVNICFLPYTAYYSTLAIIKTLYRVFISKKNLLEWQTASDGERLSSDSLFDYLKNMWVNFALGCVFILSFNFGGILFGIAFILGPFIAYYISKPYAIENINVSKNDKEILYDIAKRTIKYFLDFITEENNFLIPDNYQEGRKEKLTKRTSTTNIGLSLLVMVCGSDLKLILKEDAIEKIYKILEKISYMQKYNGHLYNWYNIQSLEPIFPRYISSVDNGNLIGYLYTLKEFLIENIDLPKVKESIVIIDKLIEETDFSFLYNYKNNLFSIGFDVETGRLTNSYYDLLASEARQTSFIAIASKQVPQKHWSNLSRSLTRNFGYKGLVSWSGTAFEYLMPNVNMPSFKTSLLDESIRFMILSQKKYADKLGIPWGISESAFSLQDLHLNYQYKAFGVPWLGLKRGLGDDVVVTPYASILALNYNYVDVIKNIKLLKKEGAYGEYGFYESIDYTPNRMKKGKQKEVVKCYMAHHQGLILLSINNFLNNNIMQKRFMKNPSLASAKILLQERMPEKTIITKENKEKIDTLKYIDNGEYEQREYHKVNKFIPVSNVLANDNYSVYMDQYGNGFSKWNNDFINNYSTIEEPFSGQFFYIKNINTKQIWTNTLNPNIVMPSKYSINFAPDRNKFTRTDSDIDTVTRITVSTEDNVEIRKLELRNNSNQDVILEISSYLEPVLTDIAENSSHPVFSHLFLSYEYIDFLEGILIKRRSRNNKCSKYMLVMFYPEQEAIGELEYGIDKVKFIGRDRSVLNPILMEKDVTLSNPTFMTTLEPAIVLRRTIKVEKEKSYGLNYVVCVGNDREEVISIAEKYNSKENIIKTFRLARAKSFIENRFYNLKASEINTFQKIMGYIIGKNDIKSLILTKLGKRKANREDLWKFGISGDNPIILIKIKYVNDIDTVIEGLKCFEYLRTKNVKFDLVILNEEKNSYEKYTKEAIFSSVLSSNSAYLLNKFAGIFILDACNMNDLEKNSIFVATSIIFDAHKGTITKQLDEYEEEIKEIHERFDYKNEKIMPIKEYNNTEILLPELKFFNKYGGFLKNEYVIKINKNQKTPMPWSNVISNGEFGSLQTASRRRIYLV